MQKGDLTRQYFIAAFPPDQATQPIRDLAQNGLPEWEWKRPEDYHISLAFPGSLTDEQVKRLISVLGDIKHQPFNLSFDGLSFHLKDPVKDKTRNHVIWARPDNEGDNELRELIHKIVDKLARRQFRHGMQTLSPHLTVARPPPEAGELTKEFAKAHSHIKAPAWTLDRFYLCETRGRSDPDHPENNGGTGSRYKKIAEFRLTA